MGKFKKLMIDVLNGKYILRDGKLFRPIKAHIDNKDKRRYNKRNNDK